MEQINIFLLIRRGKVMFKGLINLIKNGLIKHRITLTFSTLLLVVGLVSGFMLGNIGNYVYGAEPKIESQIKSVPITEPSNLVIEPVQSKPSSIEEICLDISGAVVAPGVYCLDPENRLFRFIESAGGFDYKKFAKDYVYQRINLASFPKTDTKVYIPYTDEVVCKLELPTIAESPNFSGGNELDETGYDSDSPIESDTDSPIVEDESAQENADDNQDSSNTLCEGKVGLNKTSSDELQELPGIGASTAQKIIDARPFIEIEGLLNVSGIGEAKFSAIKELVCID